MHAVTDLRSLLIPLAAALLSSTVSTAAPAAFQSADLYKLRSVGEVKASPDGRLIAYSVQRSERPGRPYTQLFGMDVTTRRTWQIGPDGASSPRWSPDGKRIAFVGRDGDGAAVMVANADGSGVVSIAPVRGTNHPLPSSGARLDWSPDGTQIAFVSATDGPELDANGDPMVVTRYLYKPTASEGQTRFNDNRRLHIFVADVATRRVRQLTTGNYYEHSIDWSPSGAEIVFVSNRGPDPDRVFNYDVFAVNVSDGRIRRLTDTPSAEYRPVWSPDGRAIAYQATTRPLTSSETTMEDTHVWVMDADGTNRREVGRMDLRQAEPTWSRTGSDLFFTAQTRGSTRLYRQPVAGGDATAITPVPGTIGAWSFAGPGSVAYAFATPARPAELFLQTLTADAAPARLTTLNEPVLAERTVAPVESFVFKSFDGLEVEAFLTLPATRTDSSKHPLIVMIHGGPHGQQGPAFTSKAQVYAAQGWAALMVNYRGSTGYGQKFADAIFKDQNGGEAKDVVAGVDAALARYPWLDATRMGIEGGSYGGQLANWIITQTDRFRAAIPTAGISNLVSTNYMAYYHDYLAVEFGGYPHENGIMDLLWERSPIRYVNRVRTPVMFLHGENDNDVPIAEAEQYYIALRDVGVESIMIRYPREGHGLRETGHVVDSIDRSIQWYRRYFEAPKTSNVR